MIMMMMMMMMMTMTMTMTYETKHRESFPPERLVSDFPGQAIDSQGVYS